jgi:hypothetical protein
VLGVTGEIIIEGQRNGRSFPATRWQPFREDFIDRHEINDLAERLQLRSENVDRHRRNNLGSAWDSRSEAMIDEHETMSADTCKRSYRAVHR